MSERRPAATIQELDVHLGYVQQAIGDIQRVVASMATKQDITELAKRMDSFATKDELERLSRRLDGETAGSKLKRLASAATSLMAIITLVVVCWAGITYVVHMGDFLHGKMP